MKKLVLLLFIPLAFAFCKKENQENDQKIKSAFTVMTNSIDPLIASTLIEGGGTIDFFGERDEQGIPALVNRAMVNLPDDTTRIIMDDSGRPVDIITQNGIQFRINWQDKKNAVITAITPDGETQVNTDISFRKADFGLAERLKTGKKGRAVRDNRSLKLAIRNQQSPAYREASLNSNCIVNVKSCETPSPGEAWVLARDKDGKKLGTFPAAFIEKGKYGVNIPTKLVPAFNPSGYCKIIAEVLEVGCVAASVPGFTEVFCTALMAAVASTGIGALAAAAIEVGCLSATKAFQFYCISVSASAVPGSPSLAGLICNSEFINRNFNDEIVLFPYVIALPKAIYGTPATVPADGPFPELHLSLGSKTTIRNLKTLPASPGAEQDYTAFADVFCLKKGSVVKVSVVGSDLYEDEVEYKVGETISEGEFKLEVPGADGGVKDTITLQIILPDGTTMVRVMSLVFG